MIEVEDKIIEILEVIKSFHPEINDEFTDEVITTNLNVASAYLKLRGLEKDDDNYKDALALKTLSLLYLPSNSSMTSQRVKDVEIRYYQGMGKSKWDMLLDALLDGDDHRYKELRYIGF